MNVSVYRFFFLLSSSESSGDVVWSLCGRKILLVLLCEEGVVPGRPVASRSEPVLAEPAQDQFLNHGWHKNNEYNLQNSALILGLYVLTMYSPRKHYFLRMSVTVYR